MMTLLPGVPKRTSRLRLGIARLKAWRRRQCCQRRLGGLEKRFGNPNVKRYQKIGCPIFSKSFPKRFPMFFQFKSSKVFQKINGGLTAINGGFDD